MIMEWVAQKCSTEEGNGDREEKEEGDNRNGESKRICFVFYWRPPQHSIMNLKGE